MKFKITTFIFLFGAQISFAQSADGALNKLKKTADSLYDSQASYHLSLKVFLQLDSLLQDTPDAELAFYTRSRIAKNYNAIDNTAKSIFYSNDNLLRSRQAGNIYYHADALLNLVVSHTLNREFDTALEYYEKSEPIIAQSDSLALEMDAKNALAFLHVVNGDTDQAILNYQKALKLATKLGAQRLKNKIYANLSYCYLAKTDYPKAIEIGKQALAESAAHGFNAKYIIPSNIGASYQLLQQYDSALHYYKMSGKLAADSGVKLHMATANYDIGSFYFERGAYNEAVDYFNKSYELADGIKSYPAMARADAELSNVYEKLGEYQNSLMALRRHHLIKDSLAERSKQQKLEEFQTKYETKEKEEQIVLLDQENALKEAVIKQKEYQRFVLWITFSSIVLLLGFGMWGWQKIRSRKLLAQQENLRYKSIIETEQKERKRIAQDLHDSLGQTLSTIRLQAATLPVAKDHVQPHENLLKQVDHAYDELRNISQNIMPDTLIKLGLVPAIRELITELSVDDVLKIELEAEEPVRALSEDESVNLYRIVQEILSNTIKHAQATWVNVILENKNKHLALRISDNGRGIDADEINQSKGMGWKNIISRATLISAKMDVRSKPDHGTTISILV